MNLEVNRGSLSLMTFLGSLYRRTMTSRNKRAVSSAVMVLLHGTKCTILVQLWSIMVSIKSYPLDGGNLVIKSNATTSKGFASPCGYIGCRGALVGLLFTLCQKLVK